MCSAVFWGVFYLQMNHAQALHAPRLTEGATLLSPTAGHLTRHGLFVEKLREIIDMRNWLALLDLVCVKHIHVFFYFILDDAPNASKLTIAGTGWNCNTENRRRLRWDSAHWALNSCRTASMKTPSGTRYKKCASKSCLAEPRKEI